MAILVSLPVSGTASAEILARWVTLGPQSRAELRVVTDEASCPALTIDGRPVAMALRDEPDAAHPVRVCALPLPAGARTATFAGEPVPLPAAAPQRIVVIGDTGCRVRGANAQSCNDPAAWPFKAIADRAAALQPDLVIHTGDYLYRESPCPTGNQGCAGSPHGDTWATWSADFFAPAASLLRAAPWVMVRGNHEICARAGHGWTRLLDPYPLDPTTPCPPHARPHAVDLGGLRLVVLDVSTTGESEADPALVPLYRADYAETAALASGPTWLVQHRPLRSVYAVTGTGGERRVTGGDATLLAATEEKPPPVDLVLSGHLHTFQVLDFAPPAPPQMIVGNSGTRLDDIVLPDPAGLTIGGALVRSGVDLRSFGLVLLTRSGEGWDAEVYSADGRVLRTCRIGSREMVCGDPT